MKETKVKNITEIIPNKKYQIRIEKGRRQDGSRNRVVETFSGTLKQAIAYRDELIYEMKHSKLKPGSNMNFLEFTRLWLRDYAEVSLKPTTLDGYKDCLNAHILPHFKDYKLEDITVYELEKFYNVLRKTKSRNRDSNGKEKILSESAVKHQHALLSVMLNTAVKWDFIEYNPCSKLIKKPTPVKKEMNFYNEDELGVLLDNLENEDLTFKAVIYLLVLGGCRRGEALGLTWDLVDFENETITIKRNLLYVKENGVYTDKPKTLRSKRTISVPSICFELLKELKSKQVVMKEMYKGSWVETQLDYVFKDEYGNYFNPNRLTRNWNAFIRKHNLKHIRLHDLRHTCATFLLSHNTPIATVSKKLGHADNYTTYNFYTHSIDRDEVESSKLLNDMVYKLRNKEESEESE